MDRLNARLAASIQARARLALTISRRKARLGLACVDLARERAMVRDVLAAAPEGLPRRDLERIFRAIFGASRRLVVRAGRARRA
jgi:chorismate mutase